VECETGGTFDPYSVGAAGELGAVQLHPRYALKDFYRVGYQDPYNPYEAVYFLAEALAGNRPPLGAWTWSCK